MRKSGITPAGAKVLPYYCTCTATAAGTWIFGQARHRGRKNLAAIEGRKSVAESRPRSLIPKRHRGHQIAAYHAA
jgi:hypothetical protein